MPGIEISLTLSLVDIIIVVQITLNAFLLGYVWRRKEQIFASMAAFFIKERRELIIGMLKIAAQSMIPKDARTGKADLSAWGPLGQLAGPFIQKFLERGTEKTVEAVWK